MAINQGIFSISHVSLLFKHAKRLIPGPRSTPETVMVVSTESLVAVTSAWLSGTFDHAARASDQLALLHAVADVPE